MLLSFSKKTIIILSLYLSICDTSYSQMPDWVMVKDPDGNKFYFDQNGKIWTSGEPEFEYRPVSINGLEYYLNQGIELLREYYIAEGLTLLKSIMCMPATNNKIYEAQKRARMEIDAFKKKEGDRYNKFSISSSILLYRDKDAVTVVNDLAEYSVMIPASFKLVRRKNREEHNYRYCGLTIGIRFKSKGEKSRDNYDKFDMLLAVDSDIFVKPLQSVERVEMNTRNRLGADTFKRELIEKSEKQIVYSYRDNASPYYAGYECFYLRDNKGHVLRTICSRENFEKYRDEIAAVVKSFKQ